MKDKILISRKFVCALLGLVIILFFGNILSKAVAQIKKEEEFKRPAPEYPISPQIPGANRFQQDKIFLEYADSLFRTKSLDTVVRQILKGSVKFRQAGLWMYCDSAYYYPDLNSLDAFGNVKMEQGDTFFVYADQLFYDGNTKLAKLKNGPSRQKVTLINNDVTLTTDSLDYDLGLEYGWYSKWGTIDDKVNTLTSLFGEYSSATKEADFFHDVILVNNRDGYTLLTDTLHYNTATHIALIESQTEIQSENDTILTTKAIYNTESGNADLLTRSVILHRDSAGNILSLEGDSIIYDKASHISKAYMFRDKNKRSLPMVLTDTAQNLTLIGGFGIYNDSTREALATYYPVLMEYSQNDTLFLRADTIKTFVITERVPVRFKWRKWGFPMYNDLPLVKLDSTGIYIDTVFFKVTPPMHDLALKLISPYKYKAPDKAQKIDDQEEPKNDDQEEPENDQFLNFIETLDTVSDYTQSLLNNIPKNDSITDSVNYNKIDITIPKEIENKSERPSEEDLANPIIELPIEEEKESADSLMTELKDFHIALAYHRARFFKSDMQGIADSIVFVEKDSLMYMFRKPIVWSGERQVTGNRIDVHFNDSTVDWTLLPESGMISEHIDEDFYNQIAGKNIYATYANQTLDRLEVSGNVETIFLPQESDSTYNRMVNAESSFLELEMKDNQMDKLKMWPDVSGTVTPIFMVKNAQKYLQKFHWWGYLRPEREWVGDELRWADNLGEVSEELEEYFSSPSDFGEPKTFTGNRIRLPLSTLPVWDDMEAVEDTVVNNITLSEIEENEEELQKEVHKMEENSEEIKQLDVDERDSEESELSEEQKVESEEYPEDVNLIENGQENLIPEVHDQDEETEENKNSSEDIEFQKEPEETEKPVGEEEVNPGTEKRI